jgi:WD repeat-containing protein 42A
MQFDLRDGNNKSTFQCHTLTGSFKMRRHPVRLSAIVINSRNPNYFAVGGSDKYARVYDIRKVHWGEQSNDDSPVASFYPAHLKGKGSVHVTALAYSFQEELLVSYNDEHIYLFDKLGSIENSQDDEKGCIATNELQVYKGHRNARTVKGVSFLGLNTEYVVSGSDCGNVFIWRKNGANLVALFRGDGQVVNCLEPHPNITVLATSGMDSTAKVWAPIAEDSVPLPADAEKVISSFSN